MNGSLLSVTESSPPVKVLAIGGSLRSASYNRLLLKEAGELAPGGMGIELFENLAAIPLFNEELETGSVGGPASVHEFQQQVGEADGLLISTPEYNQSMPGVLKNAIDWLSRGGSNSVLRGKPVAIVGATMGPWGTRFAQAYLRHVLYATESLPLPAPNVFIRGAADSFDASGKLIHEPSRAAIAKMLHAFHRWILQVAPRELEAR